ncbi:zinc finger protein-domain-containing protein [Microdochium trichocladiopsis]|uniref:Zinc finger protein-domain-containing protein n=1 Tax=Microdochium trichocladiopsis TaxID=1682393 RepID=A0A9P9BLI4_9PEZI|nr:zinc finger protein-domain-containing protein [Microdochium trichocladiopsis]KAH7028117.1 zinc finger protein-domain-containing protein [Microdochium trichocladiopsis]
MDFTRLILDQPGQLRRIGMGHCGSVWANDEQSSASAGTTFVIKREDCGPGRSIKKEFDMHKIIMAAQHAHRSPATIFVPQNRGFLATSDPRWTNILPRLPNNFEPCNAIINERIPALGVTGRTTLVHRFCPNTQGLQDWVLKDVNNSDCLARVYLGSRRQQRPKDGPPLRFFKLRDIPLHLDQFSELDVDPIPYARAMAEGLAFLWFQARVDANDVEFVLASPPAANQVDNNDNAIFESKTLGRHAMWVLDFDCCNPLSMDNDGVEAAARCFWRNDPYYPRPPLQTDNAAKDASSRSLLEDEQRTEPAKDGSTTLEDALWTEFSRAFLAAGEKILMEDDDLRDLPKLVLDRINATRGLYDKTPCVF